MSTRNFSSSIAIPIIEDCSTASTAAAAAAVPAEATAEHQQPSSEAFPHTASQHCPIVDFSNDAECHYYGGEPLAATPPAVEIGGASGNSESTEATAAEAASNRAVTASVVGREGEDNRFGPDGEPFEGFLSAAITDCLSVHLESPKLDGVPQPADDYAQLEELLLNCYYADPDSYLNTLDPTLTVQLSDSEKALVEAEKVVVWMLSHPLDEIRVLVEYPGARTARFTDGLQAICANSAEDAWDKYIEAGVVKGKRISVAMSLTPATEEERLYQHLSGFYHHYVVDPATGELACCLSDKEEAFVNADFRVYSVDDFGSLMNLLCQLSDLSKAAEAGEKAAMAVDFEGLNLSRDGAMSLAQLCLSSDPRSVYVVDITRLGFHAFHATTHTGTSLKSIMEDTLIEKVFYDPRHDVDALYYQFNVAPQNVFDLQLAEVALRRARGLTVRYVIGLFKCLVQSEVFVQPELRDFATRINDIGKALFEPKHGGSYKVFTERPLHPGIIVYASHDARYLLPLYETFTKQLKYAGDNWYNRVLAASARRAEWYQHSDYLVATSEAPDI